MPEQGNWFTVEHGEVSHWTARLESEGTVSLSRPGSTRIAPLGALTILTDPAEAVQVAAQQINEQAARLAEFVATHLAGHAEAEVARLLGLPEEEMQA